MTDSVFNAYSVYYDLLYQDKNYPAEAGYIKNLLYQHGVKNGNLLEFGSGTGRHGRLLAAHGFNVHGVERSRDMVDRADLASGFSCEQGDICTVQLNRTFNAVLSLFHVVSYQVKCHELQAVFKNAANHLQPGGLFIFDFWYTPSVFYHQPVVRVKRMANDKVEVTRIAEPTQYVNENRVDVNYTIFARDLHTDTVKTLRETHSMRHFSLPEIDILGRMNNLELVHAEEFLTAQIPSEKTWGVCVVLRRNNLA